MAIANWNEASIRDLEISVGYLPLLATEEVETVGQFVNWVADHGGQLSDLNGVAAGSRGEAELRQALENFMAQAVPGWEWGQRVDSPTITPTAQRLLDEQAAAEAEEAELIADPEPPTDPRVKAAKEKKEADTKWDRPPSPSTQIHDQEQQQADNPPAAPATPPSILPPAKTRQDIAKRLACLDEILLHQQTVDQLKREYDKARDASLKAKKAWDEAVAQQGDLVRKVTDPQQELPFEEGRPGPGESKTPALDVLAEERDKQAEPEPAPEPEDEQAELDEEDAGLKVVAPDPVEWWEVTIADIQAHIAATDKQLEVMADSGGLENVGDLVEALKSGEFRAIKGFGGQRGQELQDRVQTYLNETVDPKDVETFLRESGSLPDNSHAVVRGKPKVIKLKAEIAGFADAVAGAKFEIQEELTGMGYICNDSNGAQMVIPLAHAEVVEWFDGEPATTTA